jgi:hypothetical protein
VIPVIVWLWDASGPARTACGVTDDEGSAFMAAETLLAGGQITVARVERATMGLGTGSMTYGYQPTGEAWQARLRGRRVTWKRETRTPHLAAS